MYDDTTRARINGPKKSINERYRPTYKKWLGRCDDVEDATHILYVGRANDEDENCVRRRRASLYTIIHMNVLYTKILLE